MLMVFGFAILYGQSLKKYGIGDSGCSVYSFCDHGKFDVNFSEDAAKVYTSECGNADGYYGVICIKLLDSITNLPKAESVLVAYLDNLKKLFKITSSTGYGKGHRLKGKETTRGILDYWNDEEQNNWKVKGWTDGKFIAVLYTYSQKTLNETKANAFLDGLLFEGM